MTAVLRCSALDDEEDSFPTRPNLRIMPNDDNETTDTLAPPTDREVKTNPENEAPEPRNAAPPPALPNPFAEPPPWWEGSFFQATFNKMTAAAEAIAMANAGQEAILAAVQQADRNQKGSHDIIVGQIASWRTAGEAKDKAQDEALAELRRDIDANTAEMLAAVEAAVREAVTPFAQKLEKLEQALEELKKNEPTREPQAAAPAT